MAEQGAFAGSRVVVTGGGGGRDALRPVREWGESLA
jgi:hypothetical protein